MALRHRITINVTDPQGKTGTVLKGADVRLPARLIRFLFGDFTQVYLLKPGQTVESVDVKEVKGKMNRCAALDFTQFPPCQSPTRREAEGKPGSSPSLYSLYGGNRSTTYLNRKVLPLPSPQGEARSEKQKGW